MRRLGRGRQAKLDAIVVGLGGMGSAALYHLARRGVRVLGLERFAIPHEHGSSHGLTRILRIPYYEHSAYVPLVQRARILWQELQAESQTQLFVSTGSLDIGRAESRVFSGSLESCLQHRLVHEVFTSAALGRRFPAYRMPADMMAVYQADGGFLLPERCIVAHVAGAQAAGADVRTEERVVGWTASATGVIVATGKREYRSRHLVLTAGAWMAEIAGLPIVAERQVLAWLAPRRPELFMPSRFPVFNLEVEPHDRYYGIPTFGIPGFKLGRYHHFGETGSPDDLDREVHEQDEDVLRHVAKRFFPAGAGRALALRTCLFENSPDEHFIIDFLPNQPRVVAAAGFSGHGFKFCSVVGEILADLVTNGETAHEVGFLRLSRLLE